MTWVRTEDSMPLHWKVLRLSDGAYRLWSNALHFANRAVTDGKIFKDLVPSLNHHGRWSPKQLAGFVEELSGGLWIDRGDHFEIHDYAHHQAEALKDRVERKRELDRERQRKKREREEERARESLGMSRRDSERDSDRDTTRESHDGHAAKPRSRPDPARPDLSPSGESVNASAPEPSQAKPGQRTHPLGSGPIVGGIDPEEVRLAYVERWEKHARGKRPPMVARGFGSPVWSDLAQAFVDRETTTQILDAAFVDPFVRSTGWTPKAILGAMPRLSTADVRRNDAENPANGPGEDEGSGEATESILGALRARHDEELLLAEKCALRGDADGKLRHTAEAARLRVEWRQTRDSARQVAS